MNSTLIAPSSARFAGAQATTRTIVQNRFGSYRTTARVVGAIYIAGFVVGIGGNILIQSILGAPNHLATVSANSMQPTWWSVEGNCSVVYRSFIGNSSAANGVNVNLEQWQRHRVYGSESVQRRGQ